MRHILYYIFVFFILFNCKGNKHDEQIFDPEFQTDIEKEIPGKVKNDKVEIIGLLYHRFGDQKYSSTNISTSLFEKHLKYLKENEFQVITLSQALNHLLSKDVAGRYVVISIDDGFKSFLENGFPLLKKYEFNATLFINTETVGKGDYLNWDELAFISSNGIEIGNHTHSHAYFLDMDHSKRYNQFKNDVMLSQRIIDEKLDIQPIVFAYPYGEYDSLMMQEIKEMGFLGAAAQNSGVISQFSDIYALPRFPMTDQYGKMESFEEKLKLKPLPVVHEIPETNVATANPPSLIIQLEEGNYNLDQGQCFIQGGSCDHFKINSINRTIEIRSGTKLKNRRHLYTITVPDKTGREWYWYSHQWIFTNIKE